MSRMTGWRHVPRSERVERRHGAGNAEAERLVALCRLLSAVAALLVGCSDNLPGDVIGAYRVTMRLDDNSCGERGLPLPDGYAYAVELRADEPRGYWRTPGAAPIEGRYQRGSFEFGFAMTLDLGRADAGTAGCLVRREELLRGEVTIANDAGVGDAAIEDAGRALDDEALSGEHVISFTPDPNGRCANVRGPIDVFAQLPCSARYRLLGAPTKPF